MKYVRLGKQNCLTIVHIDAHDAWKRKWQVHSIHHIAAIGRRTLFDKVFYAIRCTSVKKTIILVLIAFSGYPQLIRHTAYFRMYWLLKCSVDKGFTALLPLLLRNCA